MRTLEYNDIELTQYVKGDDWFVFTDHLVIHAPLERLLSVLDDILTNKPHVVFLEELDLVNAVGVYQEEHYPETFLDL